jgi:hypothetical protein
MLFPPSTGFGEADAVTARSACVAVATVTFAVASLLFGFGSLVAAKTFAVSEMTVPAAVPGATFSTGWNVADPPAAREAMVQVMVPAAPTAGVEQDHPAGVDMETKVVFAGRVSVNVTVEASPGPALLTTCVYEMLFPATTGLGVAELVTRRSAAPGELTIVLTLAELLDS